MSGKKFELVKEDTKQVGNRILYRVKYLRDGKYFNKGDLGGYIEFEKNLSQENNACVSGNACVFGDARVFGDAWVFGNARVFDDACVFGDAWVFDDACVFGDAWVSGDCKIDFELCSKFSFENQLQLDKWLELEKQFESIKNDLKPRLEDLSKEELIKRIKELEGKK